MSKKTQEEYIKEVYDLNPGIEVVGLYVGAKTNITHHCLIHDTYWDSAPSNVLQGKSGCKDCSKEKLRIAKTKTEEEYKLELAEQNPNIILIGKYVSAKNPTLHKCLLHEVEYFTSPEHALRGQGCRKCGELKLNQFYNTRKKTDEQYMSELSYKNPTIELVGEYINYNTAVKHYCKLHNLFFDIRPADALHGKGCKQCKSDKIRLSKLISEDDYIEELGIKNHNVELVGKYIDRTTPVEHKCLIHNAIWSPRPYNVLYGMGCPQCLKERISKSRLKTSEQYVTDLSIKNDNLTLIDDYVGKNTPIKHFCNKHQVYFNIAPEMALRGIGCPQCITENRHNAMVKSEEQYILELQDANPNIVLIGNYVGGHTRTMHKCLIDGFEWMTEPSYILSGSGCPNCNKSKGEMAVELWLQQHNIDYIPQKRFDDCRDKNTLPFDFYLPSQNLCIEYQGRQHYESVEYFGGEENLQYVQYHDEIKRIYCLSNNISLLCIPHWENVDDFLNENLLI